ncbi:MAG TPA: choice-of-anchor D domain-containing protein, partial [Spirochaetota bacterium]|nr:choice-of-anchor D domain-containing protein [Spirochaetota bacterium]
MKKLQVLKRKSGFTVLLCAMVVVVAIAGVGCGGGGGGSDAEAPVESPDVTSPYVTSRMPDMNETGVAVNSEIRVVFSEYMDNNTLTTDMFFISKDGQPVSGSITYNAGMAAFRPSASLEYSTVYTVTLKSSVADVSGNSMGQDIIWQFTTASAPAPEIEVLKGLTAIPSGTANVHDFGGVTVGNNSSQVTFTVRNTGSADLLMNGSPRVQSSSSEFTIDSQPSSPVTGGDETTFTVTFRPSTTGSKTATITILSNDSNEGTYTFTVKGTATPVPEPEIHVKKGETDVPSGTTGAHDFGSVIVGQSGSTVTFKIQNIGTADLNLTGTPRVTSSNSEFTVETQPATPVDDGDETTFTVKFTPQNTGSRSATITINSNDSDEGNYTFTVTGTGAPVPEPEINVMQGSTNVPNGGSVDFGRVLAGNTITKSFTVQNLGSAALSLTGNPVVEISGDDAGCFTVNQQPITSVEAGNNITFTISFASTESGVKNTQIKILNNDLDESEYTITISGNSAEPLVWNEITSGAQWTGRSNFASIVYNNKIWIIGGLDWHWRASFQGGSYGVSMNDVWSSDDGVTWTNITSSAQWSGRCQHSVVVFNDGSGPKMWLIGGYGLQDAWCSSDGQTWELKSEQIPWFTGQRFTFVFNNELWSVSYLDVWKSSDGVNWTLVTNGINISGLVTCTVYDNKMWCFTKYGYVYYSSDGITWNRISSTIANYLHGYTVTVNDQKMWLIGGDKGVGDVLPTNEMYSSIDGISWQLESNTGWSPRYEHSSLVFNNRLVILGGREGTGNQYVDMDLNDVWMTARIGVPTGVDASDAVYTDKIRIQWDEFQNAEKYYVYRAESSDGIYNLITPSGVSGNYFEDTTAGKATTYWYKVTAYISGTGETGMSDPESGWMYGFYAPSSVSASDGLYNWVRVSWSSVPEATFYNAYRRKAGTQDEYQRITTQSLCIYDDYTVSADYNYEYRVKAYSDKYGY